MYEKKNKGKNIHRRKDSKYEKIEESNIQVKII